MLSEGWHICTPGHDSGLTPQSSGFKWLFTSKVNTPGSFFFFLFFFFFGRGGGGGEADPKTNQPDGNISAHKPITETGTHSLAYTGSGTCLQRPVCIAINTASKNIFSKLFYHQKYRTNIAKHYLLSGMIPKFTFSFSLQPKNGRFFWSYLANPFLIHFLIHVLYMVSSSSQPASGYMGWTFLPSFLKILKP